MGQLSDDESGVICRKLSLILPSFYILYYIVGAIYLSGFGLPMERLGVLPFNIADDDFKPLLRDSGQEDRELPLASWLAAVTTIPLATVLIFVIVKNTSKAWDYASTISLVHALLSIAVSQSFPVNWIWWVTLIVCTFILSSLSEISIYYLHDMVEIAVEK
mmetsp:Transcript_21540/g.41083  ORF Transcript_21540/g.41083 Transcript_21540/m.41083 type:complete len:161 (+) Transcript_21540:361-843(+)|eukprot:CAMPEP_0114255214 /NCGR_PEP_ID=MMETSP0058-20121206/17427_1 /TAXON_ID=36894 /ORGANISM="Pyramimonas parkeae, CCMP726" /LENGTH=160 /DNA_ID=CAMNT_0001369553 /DNA_START=361 /DNA_END=843 /DNA_ORIENTATION=-